MDIAPTVLNLLNISGKLSGEGRVLPVAESFVLRVTGAPSGLSLWRGGVRLADAAAASASGDYRFLGLSRGQYILKAGGKEWGVLVNGDAAMDLTGKAAPQGNWKRIIGIVLILAINLAGIAIIVRIWKRNN
ncbi:MAG: hypothetical protein A4E49_02561 [Methanosaeta sp. PtaU1.Bin112]|nr:MAG: hypothetical protein A4E49_02561 [Methanosaeta sp. PtaU1.Bin112]